MKILYLHGLDSFLQDDRREVLEKKAEIYAPTLDYKAGGKNLFNQLITDYKQVNAIIGSSAGGLITYYLAQILNKPCLLFNPALPFKKDLPFEVSFDKNYQKLMQIVLGFQDEIIPYHESLKIIFEDITETQNIDIHIINQMKHSYDIHIFSKEFEFFLNKVEF